MNNRDNADVTMTSANMFPGQEKTAQEDPQKAEIHIPFKCLSELTTSFTGGSLAVIASRPAMGKTSFALDIAKILAANSERNIVFFSLELSVEWVIARLRMKDSHSEAIPPNILIYDEYFMSVTGIKRICESIENLGAVIIDYIQLLSSEEDHKQERNRFAEMIRIQYDLKQLAQKLNVPVICLSQLSRSLEHRADKHPMLSDSRDSGISEEATDQILFLYRDRYYNTNTPLGDIAECIIRKNRCGELGTLKLQWNPKRCTFMI